MEKVIMMKSSTPPVHAALAPVTLSTPSGLRIHNIQTGWVAVKETHREYHGLGSARYAALALDPRWTEWLPINTWVIEHREGVIVIDTGETARIADPAYSSCDPGTSFVYQKMLRFAVTPEDEIVAQLALLNIKPSDVRWVIQTHLHSDHMGGLSAFLRSEIMLSGLDYPSALGTLPCRYDPKMSPTLVNFTDSGIIGFDRVHRVTRAGDVLIVPTPGHTAGHQSVILQDGDTSYFFAGDTSFTQTHMLTHVTAGIALNFEKSRATTAHIQAYCRAHPTVYLPSHDADSQARLLARSVVTF